MDDVAREPAPSLSGAGEAILFAIAGLCVALDVGLGTVVNLIKLPVYLDAVGTIAFALLAGRMGFRGFIIAALVGTAGFVITGLLFNPVVLWFIPTQIAIAAFSFYVARPLLKAYLNGGSLTGARVGLIALLGIGLGIVAGAVSAPIIAFVFGGITGAGASLIVAALLKAGSTLFQSVLASGIASEPIDKTLQLIAALALVRATPSRARRFFF
jgi:energy-coupling factor transport system substrate-specific component